MSDLVGNPEDRVSRVAAHLFYFHSNTTCNAGGVCVPDALFVTDRGKLVDAGQCSMFPCQVQYGLCLFVCLK